MRYYLITFFFLCSLAFGCTPDNAGRSEPDNGTLSGAGIPESAKSGEKEKKGGDEKGIPKAEKKESNLAVETIYTDLAEDKCVDAEKDESEEWSIQSCKGVGGYRLLVSEGDLRQTIDIVAPDNKKFELEYWTVVSSGFSTVGDKAEWRVVKEDGKVKPIALIVRYNVNEDPENTEKITSYLSVSKITPTGACVTDVVKPIKNANTRARELADISAEKPCLRSK